MPTYSSISKEIRLKFKGMVEEYIIEKLGSRERLQENIMFARAQGVVFSTFGISSEWEDDFRAWACSQLRCLFGVENVPIQAWEDVVS